MDRVEAVFMEAIRSALRGVQMTDDPCLSKAEWAALLSLASEQETLSLVYEAIMNCKSFRQVDKVSRNDVRDKAVALSAREIMQTNEFLTLMLHLRENGFMPAVLKGLAVRRLYPKPALRPSLDEDIIIEPLELRAVHALLIGEGLVPDSEYDLDDTEDLSYHKPGSPAYIELHTAFFPGASAAYGDCGAHFEGAMGRTVEFREEDVVLRTLEPTDHLLYLMLHAYKHFLHGGMGVRHVCDIGVFAQSTVTDGARIRTVCDEMGLTRLFAAVFAIGKDLLGMKEYPAFSDIEVDPEPLLADMLSGGLYGVEDVNRAHSSTLTLEAVASHKKGRRRKGVLHSVFLPKRDLAGRYPYLKKHGWLLPIAWAQRGISYLRSRKNNTVSPSESLRIGRERVELLRKYGIID